jgi:putative transposase
VNQRWATPESGRSIDLDPPSSVPGPSPSEAKDSGLVPSMGSVGDCYDNGLMESFWSCMQVELLNRRRWTTRIELANAIFEYLEIFHNRQRRHSALGYLTPIEFENKATPVA